MFEDTNGNGVFDRGPDAFTPNPVGCMVFHPAHGHWHFEEFASYELRAPTGAMVADNSKVSFCVIDFDRFDSSLPGYPNNSFYNNCDEGDTEGISVGWSDTYHRSLPGQEIDITGVPDGDYCVAVAADPSNIVRESDDLNNEALKPIALSGNSVSGSSTGCGGSPPPPPPPPPPPQGGDQAVAQLAAVAQPAAGATPAKCKKKNKKKGSKKKRRKCRRYAR